MSPTNFWDFACVSAVTVGVCWCAVAIVAYWDDRTSRPNGADLAEMNAELRREVERLRHQNMILKSDLEFLAANTTVKAEPKSDVERRFGLEPGTLDQPPTTLPEPE